MFEPVTVAMYGDLSCPFAYVAHARWRRLRLEFAGRIALTHASLALEYVNREPTPRAATVAEIEILAREEPDLPYSPWSANESAWPVTFWPAFEAVKCAERQSAAAADDLAWAIRVAFFSEHRCVSLRHVLIDLAVTAGLDGDRFTDDFDGGVAKRRVIEEARDGWERLRVPGSPTFVFPSGRQEAAPGLPSIDLDPETNAVRRVEPADCRGDRCLDRYRALFAGAIPS